MTKFLGTLLALSVVSCHPKKDCIHPEEAPISSSIYASGLIKSKNQYQVISTVNGTIESVFVSEGDLVKKGSPLFGISNETQKLSRENAELAERYSDIYANDAKLNDAKLAIDLARNRLKTDSLLFVRQTALWKEQIGTRIDLEQKELQFLNSKTAYTSAIFKYEDLKRQLKYISDQSKKNLQISGNIERDFTVRSEISGKVYAVNKSKGDMANPQTALAIIGDADHFIVEMQVDESDIIKIRPGLLVIVNMQSYRGKAYEAKITKINPLMNERSKTFVVEATFIEMPERLYPNISFEASIVLETKDKALLIPRSYLLNDSTVIKASGEHQRIKTGLKDYNKVEVLAGLNTSDELIKPVR